MQDLEHEKKQELDKEKLRELLYQQSLQQALDVQNEVYGQLLQMQSTGVLAVDVNTSEVLFMNRAALNIFGFQSMEEVGESYLSLNKRTVPEDRDNVEKMFRESVKTGEGFTCEYAVDNGQRHVYVMAQTIQVKLTGGGQISLTSLTDMTEKKQMMQELLKQSRMDALTGIYNRGYGENRIQELLSNGEGGMFALFDVDRFKSINDTYGHMMGDRVLMAVANTMKKNSNEDSVVMRLGGDEFALFLPDADSREEGEKFIKNFFRDVEKLRLEGMEDRQIVVSLGAVMCEKDCKKSFDEVYQMADSAMYRCKSTPGNRFEFY